MSVDKFRFVSPGVYVNEIDNSRIARAPEEMGPAIIGRSLRGPIMRPVRVDSYAEFADVFGEPYAGVAGGDVWREGNKSAPTYGAYAAQAYLRNSGAVTFVRLGGFEHEQKATGGEAGWKVEKTYGLFVMPLSGTEDVYQTDGFADAHLAAVIYTTGSITCGLIGKQLSGSTVSPTAKTGEWIRATAGNLEFKLSLGSEEKIVNFDKNSKKYVRSVLNTNPILLNSNITTNTQKYFLGESYAQSLKEKNLLNSSDKYAAVVVELDGFSNFKEGAKSAESGWVVSQHKAVTTSFTASNGLYPVQNLFKFVGLSEGEWNSQNLKISIEDIKPPPNEYVKFGSFTVSVRKLEDSDVTPQYLERFVNVNLDPSSNNYIAKQIGDKYTTWDYDKKEYVEYNTYNNRSKYIRVEMDQDVDGGMTDKDLIPFGFYGPDVIKGLKNVTGSLIPADTIGFIKTAITGNNPFSASFMLPEIPTLDARTSSPVSNINSVYFGIRTGISTTKRHNEEFVDYVRSQATDYQEAGDVSPSFLFTLDELSGSVSGSMLDKSKPVVWKRGSRAAGNSLTALDKSTQLLSNFNRFTLPLVGGSDGVDITEKDPFNRRVLDNGDEFTNYAFNSVKVAIESISDAEIAEINLAAVPGVDNEALTSMLIDKCEMRGDALAVIDLNGDYVPDEGKQTAGQSIRDRKPRVQDTIDNLKERGINSSYGCSFFPWVLLRDTKTNNTFWAPPSIVALGTFSSSQRSTELWFAPAGFNRGGLSEGAAGIPVVQTALRLTAKNRDDLYEANINPIATFPAEGIVIFGQKTLQVTPSALDRINVRRLMIYLKKEVSRMAKVVLFDPNIEVTWKRFTNMANPFLESVKSRFGLSDFRVVLDSSTTTPELVDRNIVYAKILLKPTRAIEFIALDFVISPTGASFED